MFYYENITKFGTIKAYTNNYKHANLNEIVLSLNRNITT